MDGETIEHIVARKEYLHGLIYLPTDYLLITKKERKVPF